ncbi:MAG: hypothetical protein ACI4XW_02735 [Candidatus Spyradocola sp.]
MAWFNPIGLAFTAVLMIPNLVYAAKCRDGVANAPSLPKWLLTLEQIGRFGCFAAMIFSPPGTAVGFPSKIAFVVYLVGSIALLLAYCAVWIFCFRKNSLARAIALSVLPSLLFLLDGVAMRSWLLTIFALLFAPCHIAISCVNASQSKN